MPIDHAAHDRQGPRCHAAVLLVPVIVSPLGVKAVVAELPVVVSIPQGGRRVAPGALVQRHVAGRPPQGDHGPAQPVALMVTVHGEDLVRVVAKPLVALRAFVGVATAGGADENAEPLPQGQRLLVV